MTQCHAGTSFTTGATDQVIDLDKMTVSIGTQSQRIMRFDTWWAVPTFGMASTLDEAKQVCSENGLPISLVKPFTVAIGEGGLYEVMLC
jgi:hypothetical protein